MSMAWLPYARARTVVHRLRLASMADWRAAIAAGRVPDTIPRHPDRAYTEWTSWRDWLGPRWRPYAQARAWARRRRIASAAAWKAVAAAGALPPDVPARPDRSYPEWTSWGDFLGTERTATQARTWLPFAEARAYVHALGLASAAAWRAHVAAEGLPVDVPTNPDVVYAGEFTAWGDWLGTGTVATAHRAFLPFRRARAAVRALRLPSARAYRAYLQTERPTGLPVMPDRVYADRWVSWTDWLGTRPAGRRARASR